jgi:hypothetical protein
MPYLPLPLQSAIARIALAIGVCGFGLAPAALRSEPAISTEYQIKAVFLYNFVAFTEWPSTAFANRTAPLRIGVLGENPFGSALDEAVRGEIVRDRKVVVQYSRQLAQLKECQLLFVSPSEKPHLADLLTELDSAPILAVSELPAFLRLGGVINFYSDGRKVRFEINPQAAQRRGLKLSSQLMSVARLVPTPAGGG